MCLGVLLRGFGVSTEFQRYHFRRQRRCEPRAGSRCALGLSPVISGRALAALRPVQFGSLHVRSVLDRDVSVREQAGEAAPMKEMERAAKAAPGKTIGARGRADILAIKYGLNGEKSAADVGGVFAGESCRNLVSQGGVGSDLGEKGVALLYAVIMDEQRLKPALRCALLPAARGCETDAGEAGGLCRGLAVEERLHREEPFAEPGLLFSGKGIADFIAAEREPKQRFASHDLWLETRHPPRITRRGVRDASRCGPDDL